MADQTLSLILRAVGIEDTARQVDTAVQEFQRLRQGAEQTAIGIRQLDTSTEDLARDLRAVGGAQIRIDAQGLQQTSAEVAAIGRQVADLSGVSVRVSGEGLGSIAQQATAIAAATEGAERGISDIEQAARGAGETLNEFASRFLGDLQAMRERITAAQADEKRFAESTEEVGAAGRQAAVGLGQASAAGQRLGEAAIGAIPGVGRLAFGLLAIGGAIGVFQLVSAQLRELAQSLTAPLRAAAESEEAVRRLNIALAGTGQFTSRSSRELQAWAGEVQQAVGIADEAVLGVAQVLAQVGGLSGPKLREATVAVIDLSSVLGQDLNTVALQVARSAEGLGEGLRRAGISIDETIPRAGRLQAVLEQLQRRGITGTAAAELTTLSGSVRSAREEWSELLESLGRPFAAGVAAQLRQATAALRDFGSALSGLSGDDDLERFGTQTLVLAGRFRTAGKASGELQRDLRLLADTRLPNIDFRIDRGNIEELRTIRQEVETQIARIRSADLAPDVEALAIRPLEERLARVNRGIQLRPQLDATAAESDIRDLAQRIQAQPIDMQITANVEALQDRLRQLAAPPPIEVQIRARLPNQQDLQVPPPPTIQAPVEVQSLDEALKRAQDDAAFDLPAFVAQIVPTLDQEGLLRATSEVLATLDKFQAQTGERAQAIVQRIRPAAEELARLAGQRNQVTLEAPAVDALRPAIAALRELRAAQTGQQSVQLGLPPVATITSISAALAEMRANLAALRADPRTTSQDLARALAAIEDRAEAVGRALPRARAEVEAFVASQRGQTAVVLDVRLSAERLARDAQAVAEQARAAVAAVGSRPVDLLRLERAQGLDQQSADAQELVAVWQDAISAINDATSTQQIASLLETLNAAERANAAATQRWSQSVSEEFQRARDELEALLGARSGLEDATRIQRQIEIDVQAQDLTAAEADLDRLRELVASLPESKALAIIVRTSGDSVDALEDSLRGLDRATARQIRILIDSRQIGQAEDQIDALERSLRAQGAFTVEIEASLRGFRRDIAQVERFSRAAGQLASEEFQQSLGDLGFDAVSLGFEGLLKGMTAQFEDLDQFLRQGFKNLIDELLRQLARLAAFKFLRALLGGVPIPGVGGLGAGVPIPLGPGVGGLKPTTGTDLPRPPASPAVPRGTPAPIIPLRPELRLEPIQPPPLQLRFAAQAPDDVRLAAPRVSVAQFAPQRLAPPELQRVPISRILPAGGGEGARTRGLPGLQPLPSAFSNDRLVSAIRGAAAAGERNRPSATAEFARSQAAARRATRVPETASAERLVSSFLPRAERRGPAAVVQVQSYNARDVRRDFQYGASGRALASLARNARR